jgi:hypothetical protein
MKQSFHIYRALLGETMRIQPIVATLWVWILLGVVWALIVLFAIFVGLQKCYWLPARLIVAATITCLCLFYFNMIASGVSALSAPVSTRLLPRLRARLMWLTIGAWAACSLASGLALGTALGNIGAAIVGVSAVLIFQAATGKLALIYSPLIFVIVVFNRQLWHALSPVQHSFLLSAGGLVLGELLVMVNGALILAQLLRPKPPGYLPPGFKLFQSPYEHRKATSPLSWLYDATLLRLYQAAPHGVPSRNGKPGRLLMAVFGPRAHWSVFLGPVALIVLACAVFGSRLKTAFQAEDAFAIELASMVVFISHHRVREIGASMYATRREQSLVRLSPRAPQNGVLNRVLASSLVWAFLNGWLILTGVMLGVGLMLGMMPAGLTTLASAACAATMLAPIVLRDRTRAGRFSDYAVSAWPAAGVMLLVAAFAALRSWLVALPWPVFGAACVLCAGVMARRRWRTMVVAPVALPCGRLATGH